MFWTELSKNKPVTDPVDFQTVSLKQKSPDPVTTRASVRLTISMPKSIARASSTLAEYMKKVNRPSYASGSTNIQQG